MPRRAHSSMSHTFSGNSGSKGYQLDVVLIEQGVDLNRIGAANVLGSLRAGFDPVEIWPLHVRAQDRRAIGHAAGEFGNHVQRARGVVVRGGPGGGQKTGDAMLSVELRHRVQRGGRGVHRVTAARSVHVQIDEARHQVQTGGFDHTGGRAVGKGRWLPRPNQADARPFGQQPAGFDRPDRVCRCAR